MEKKINVNSIAKWVIVPLLFMLFFVFLPLATDRLGELIIVWKNCLSCFTPKSVDILTIIISVVILEIAVLCVHRRWLYCFSVIPVICVCAFWILYYSEDKHWLLFRNFAVYIFMGMGVIVSLPFFHERARKQKETDEKVDVGYGRVGIYNAGIERIIRLILRANVGRSIAVFGTWGSGKTHFLNYLKYRLRELNKHNDGTCPKISVKHINLWQCNDLEDAWKSIVDGLHEAIRGKAQSPFRIVAQRLLQVLSRSEISILGVTGALDTLVNKRNNAGVEIAANTLTEKMNYPTNAAVLIIDDVERADIDIVNALLPLLERLQKISGLVVVCAIARDELEMRYENAGLSSQLLQGYMDKLFEQSICLPTIPKLHASIEFKRAIEKNYPQCKFLLQFSQRYIVPFDTPRQMMRVVERLSSIELDYMTDSLMKNETISCVFYMEILRLLYLGFLQDSRFLKQLKALRDVINEIKKSDLSNNDDESVHPEEHDNRLSSINVFDELIAEYAPGSRLLPSICNSLAYLVNSNCYDELLKAYHMSYTKKVSLSDVELSHVVSEVANAHYYSQISTYLHSYCTFETNVNNFSEATASFLKIVLSRAYESTNFARLLYNVVKIEMTFNGSCRHLINRKEFLLDLIITNIKSERGSGVLEKYFLHALVLLSRTMPLHELYKSVDQLLLFELNASAFLTGFWYSSHHDDLKRLKKSKATESLYSLFARRIIQDYSGYNSIQLSELGDVNIIRFFEKHSSQFSPDVYENAYKKAHQGNLVTLFENYFCVVLNDNQTLYPNTIRIANLMFISQGAKEFWAKLNISQKNRTIDIIARLRGIINQSTNSQFRQLLSIIELVGQYVKVAKIRRNPKNIGVAVSNIKR
ncbi:MAG: KAP family NTPase [Akkermansia sp.]|nr:KAP family NTPase [Akkermansia sp.]